MQRQEPIQPGDINIAQDQPSQFFVGIEGKSVKQSEGRSPRSAQSCTQLEIAKDQGQTKLTSLQKQVLIFKILLSVALLLLITTLCLTFLLKKTQVEAQLSDLGHLIGNHPDSCNGMLYTLNLTLNEGFLLMNVTNVPQCFLAANPGFPYQNQSRLLADGYYTTIWDEVLKAFIQVWVENAVNGNQGEKKNNSGCFPPDTQVISEFKGLVKMKDLKINDKILTKDGYSQVIGWLHKDEHLMLDYLEIGDSGERFFVTPLHNLEMASGRYEFAKKSEKIAGKKTIQGAYSPMTEAGNFYVVKSNGDKVLAHAFSFVQDPEQYEDLARMIFAYFPSGEETHPLCEWFLRRQWAMEWLRIVGFQWE